MLTFWHRQKVLLFNGEKRLLGEDAETMHKFSTEEQSVWRWKKLCAERDIVERGRLRNLAERGQTLKQLAADLRFGNKNARTALQKQRPAVKRVSEGESQSGVRIGAKSCPGGTREPAMTVK